MTYALNLPQPAFWNQANPANDAPWAARAALDRPPEGKPFWLLDGPPYANGEAHLGHLMNKCLKDAFVRFQSAQGHAPVWRAGWDCHGLPLELATQKLAGAPNRRDPAFLEACRAEASRWQARQSQTFSRLGLALEDQPWTTMDPKRETAGLRLLRDLWRAGLLVERHSPVHWCPQCQSALAASELEKAQGPKDSLFGWVPLEGAGLEHLGVDATRPAGLCFWTTTPWTLPANQAFAFASGAEFVWVDLGDKTGLASLLALPQLEAAMGRPLPVLARVDSQALAGLMARSPATGRRVPVLEAPFAKAHEGAGFVHVAPAFGPEDFDWAESLTQASLDLSCPMGPDGRYGAAAESFAGLDHAQAREAALEALGREGAVLALASAPAERQLCWRHGCPVFYRASRQWALDLDKPFDGCPEGLRSRARASLEGVEFLTGSKARNALEAMLAGRRFWTLSRDRHWGLPLPFLRGPDGAVSDATGAWWELALEAVETGGVEAYAAMAAPQGLFKENQCVDVWFDSAAAFETAGESGFSSASLVVEGADQTRGWFLGSLLLRAFRSPEAPFKALACHGFVVDAKGRKLSKSLGNAPDTEALLNEHGADALRLWALSQTVGPDVAWSKPAMESAKRELKDWRNFLRFLLAHGVFAREFAPESPLEHLALSQADRARQGWGAGFAKGQPQAALASLGAWRRWCGSLLFELSKRDLYCAPSSSRSAQRRRALLGWMLAQALPMLRPFMPLACSQAESAWGRSCLVLEPRGSFDPQRALLAADAQLWREGLMARLERERAQARDPKARFEAGEPQAQTMLGLLDCHPEHAVHGLALRLDGAPVWRRSPGWECPRCRGLFPADLPPQSEACELCLSEEEEARRLGAPAGAEASGGLK